MKYYSEILTSFYDTAAECEKAEEKYLLEQKKEVFEKDKAASEKNLDTLYVNSQKSLLQFQKDDDAFHEALRKHLKLYGSYVYKTSKSNSADTKTATKSDGSFSIFDLAKELGIV